MNVEELLNTNTNTNTTALEQLEGGLNSIINIGDFNVFTLASAIIVGIGLWWMYKYESLLIKSLGFLLALSSFWVLIVSISPSYRDFLFQTFY